MSRGFGLVQRAILAALAGGEALGTIDLVGEVYGVARAPDGYLYYEYAQHAAVRRALLGLEKKGLVTRAGRERAVIWQSAAAAAEARIQLIREMAQMAVDRSYRQQAMQFLHEQGIEPSEMLTAAKDIVLQWEDGPLAR